MNKIKTKKMFIESNRLIQLNKNLFGHGLLETKKLTPDSNRMVMPDPSLPKIKRYNIKSNNPLNYLLATNMQSQIPVANPNPPDIQLASEPQEIINDNLHEKTSMEELYSQKTQNGNNEIKEEPVAEPVVEPIVEPVAEKEVEKVEEPVVPTIKKFAITNLGENNVLLPANYTTDDELEYKIINLINEPKENYKFACENEYAKVYKKKVRTNLLIII